MDAELNEELVHLANIGGIPMGVEKRGGGHGVADVNSDDLGAAARGKLPDVDIFAVGKRVQEQKAGGFVFEELVGGGIRREEGEFCSHGRSNPTHYCAGDSEKTQGIGFGEEKKFTFPLVNLICLCWVASGKSMCYLVRASGEAVRAESEGQRERGETLE